MPITPAPLRVMPKITIPTVPVPGGVYPLGSYYADPADVDPQWVQVDPFFVGETVVTKGQRSLVMQEGEDYTNETPAYKFSFEDSVTFLQRLNAGLMDGEAPYGMLTAHEAELAIRGAEVIDVRQMMEHWSINPTHERLVELATDEDGGNGEGLLENFVIGDWPQSVAQALEEGIRIYKVTDSEVAEALKNPDVAIHALWMYGNGDSGLCQSAIWYDRNELAPTAKWGEPNKLGLYGASGNLGTWVADGPETEEPLTSAALDREAYQYKERYMMGGSAFDSEPKYLRAANRRAAASLSGQVVAGLRVARSVRL